MATQGGGTTVTFGTSNWVADIETIDFDNIVRENVPTTHLATAQDGDGNIAATSDPSEVVDYGGVTLTFQDNLDTPPPWGAAAEEVTIQYVAKNGQATGAKDVGQGYIDNYTEGQVVAGDKILSTVHIKWTGPVVRTAGA